MRLPALQLLALSAFFGESRRVEDERESSRSWCLVRCRFKVRARALGVFLEHVCPPQLAARHRTR